MNSSPKHFEGKGVSEHLLDARKKGAAVLAETHGSEIPGYLTAFTDCIKESSLILLFGWIILSLFSMPHKIAILSIFALCHIIWKTGRSALLGYARLERLHRLIEEEKYEIEHHREQEKEELTDMYRCKGLSGKLLEDVVEVLMADDNRLLSVMLEEELGIPLEVQEHPLRQATGALLGALLSSIAMIATFFLGTLLYPFIVAFFLLFLSAFIASKREKNDRVKAIVWNLGIGFLSSGVCYFVAKITFAKI